MTDVNISTCVLKEAKIVLDDFMKPLLRNASIQWELLVEAFDPQSTPTSRKDLRFFIVDHTRHRIHGIERSISEQGKHDVQVKDCFNMIP